ncbi:MAG: Spy/CpxP family protein refolding chaperone [Merismopedia sp. SIO2A8]|nr:Spy/CpxP family protein refolding chaperone [Symploca sp. SIO2B6]NET54113.1 Spy/CpxP family protein refolding chaperone [Merismopedia sp. SIO2A8]
MLLSRISVVSVLLLSLGSVVALGDPSPLLSQSLVQNPESLQPRLRGQPKLMEELNFTEEQKQELQAIHYRHKDEISAQQQELIQARQDLRQLLSSPSSTDESLRAKHQKIQQLQQQLGDLRFESMLAMRAIMTIEQRSRFSELMQERRQSSRERLPNRSSIEQPR